jgi:hypothetical protein
MICAGTKLIMQGGLEFVSNKKERKKEKQCTSLLAAMNYIFALQREYSMYVCIMNS